MMASPTFDGVLAAPFIYALEAVALAAAIARLPERVRARLGDRRIGIFLAVMTLVLLVYAAAENRDHMATGTSDRPDGMLSRDAPIMIAPARD